MTDLKKNEYQENGLLIKINRKQIALYLNKLLFLLILLDFDIITFIFLLYSKKIASKQSLLFFVVAKII